MLEHLQYIVTHHNFSCALLQFVYDFGKSGDAPTGNALADRMDPGWVSVSDELKIVGVSSPGAEYTLRRLIGSLRARYLQSQTALYPLVEKIKVFSVVHSFYLDYLRVSSRIIFCMS